MIMKKICIILILINFVGILGCSNGSDSNRSLKTVDTTNEDTTGAGDSSETNTVSAKGRVAPGEYLSLKHNLNRDDLNFNGSFVVAYRNANANGILWYSRDMSEKVPSLDLVTIDSNEARLLNNTKQTLNVQSKLGAISLQLASRILSDITIIAVLYNLGVAIKDRNIYGNKMVINCNKEIEANRNTLHPLKQGDVIYFC